MYIGNKKYRVRKITSRPQNRSQSRYEDRSKVIRRSLQSQSRKGIVYKVAKISGREVLLFNEKS